MSSYFDKVEGDYYKFIAGNKLLELGNLKKRVWARYRGYLKYIELHAFKKDLPKLKSLLKQFEEIPYGDITALHDFAHDVARAGIRLRGGMRALDNPYWLDHYDIP